MILLKIALRNLFEHQTKTLIIGSLITLGITFLVVANSLMASITNGMESSFTENFTGDLIVRAATEEDVTFIGGLGADPQILPNYPDIEAVLDADDAVSAYTPLLRGVGTLTQNEESLGFTLLWGIEPSSYFELFPDSFVLTSGERLKGGEPGIMLTQETVDTVLSEEGVRLNIGDKVALLGQNDVTGTKIREVTVRGIGYFENGVGVLDSISLVDVGTLRSLLGLTQVRVSAATSNAPVSVNEDDLFGGEAELFEDESSQESSRFDFDGILGDTSVREQYLATDNNAWHFVLVDVADGAPLGEVSESLSTSSVGAALTSENWRWGAGFVAEIAFGIGTALNGIILVVAIVAVLIIMNTILISVTERMSEIGTIRAIGGQKRFVRGMITAEVLMTTLVFGLIGIVLGSGIVTALGATGITASNLFLQILFGGASLNPTLSISSLYVSLLVVAVIGVVASLYPVSVALGIAPVQAMGKR